MIREHERVSLVFIGGTFSCVLSGFVKVIYFYLHVIIYVYLVCLECLCLL